MRSGVIGVAQAWRWRRCVALVGIAAFDVLVAGACSSFGSGTRAPVADAEPIDAGAGDSASSACAVRVVAEESVACTGDCAATVLFPDAGIGQAVVHDKSVFVVVADSNEIRVASPVESGSLAMLGPQGASVVDGTPTYISADSQHVYVSTSTEEVRFPVGGGAKEPLLRDTKAGAGPVRLGASVFFQLQPRSVVRAGKDLLNASLATVLVAPPTLALAVDGDRAFWIGTSATGEQGLLGPFPSLDGLVHVDPTVRFFVVHGDYAYVAETAGKSGIVARLRLGSGEREVVANEPSLIESLTIDGDQLYWTANRFGDGDRVLVRVDVCGGPVIVLAKELPPVGPFSFDATYAYASAGPSVGLVRVKK